MATQNPIEQSVRKARRRLFAQLLLNRLAVCWSVALGLGLAWVVAQPLLVESPPAWLWQAVVGGLIALGTVVASTSRIGRPFTATRCASSRPSRSPTSVSSHGAILRRRPSSAKS